MKSFRMAALVAGLDFLSGCTVVLPASESNFSGSESGSGASSEPLDAGSSDLCETSSRESIELFNAALDRVDRATSEAEIDELSNQLNDLFFQAGENLGANCDAASAGLAVSELIVWASEAASTRPPTSASFAEGFLGSICEIEIELTPSAQVACAG